MHHRARLFSLNPQAWERSDHVDIRLVGARDGIDAAVDLISQYGIPTIFATAHGDEATRTRAKKAQPVGWLTKPYSAQLVVQTIRAIFAREMPRRE
jgi:two-component system, response regulator PdtaR